MALAIADFCESVRSVVSNHAFGQVDERASHVRPAGSLEDSIAVVEFRKAGVTVGL